MKNDTQIKKFIMTETFQSEAQYKAIIGYCRQEYGLIINDAPKLNKDNGISFNDFIEWVESGYSQNDIVKWNGNIAILGKTRILEVNIVAIINEDGQFIQEDHKRIPIEYLSAASESDKTKVYQELKIRGLELNTKQLLLAEKFIPQNRNHIKFWNENGEYWGVVNEIKDDQLYMYCYYQPKTKRVGCQFDIPVGKIDDFQFAELTIAEYRTLRTNLEKAGIFWDDKVRRSEPVDYRTINKLYYYITDKFDVTSEVDNGKATPGKRYMAGNYYHSFEEALDDSMEIKMKRRKRLAMMAENKIE